MSKLRCYSIRNIGTAHLKNGGDGNVINAASFIYGDLCSEGGKKMNLVIEELEKMLKECEREGFGDREFPKQLREAIVSLKESSFDYRFERDLQRFE